MLLCCRPVNSDHLQCLQIGDIEVGAEAEFGEEEEEELDSEFEELSSGINRIHSPTDANIVCEDEAVMVYMTPLLLLARAKVDNTCQVKGCGKAICIKSNFVGSAVYLKWVYLKLFLFEHLDICSL